MKTCAHAVSMTSACMTCLSRGDDPRTQAISLIRAEEDHRAAVEALEVYESRIRDIAAHVLGIQPPDVATVVLLDAIERECGERRVAQAQAEAKVARLRDALEAIEGGHPCDEEHREMARAALADQEKP